ncbi:MAG: DEAD/DEAH box helicase family protein, partial [Gammaproteobacteria bacterium]
METNEVEQPIINSPYEEPKAHWKIHTHEPAEKRDGRRDPTYIYLPSGKSVDEEGEYHAVEEKLQLVSQLREQVNEWRSLALRGEGGVSRVTMELLKHWHNEEREQRLFFAQLEAAETIIFLTEARADFLQGVDIPQDKVNGTAIFRRLCCRMATGSGKTTVMAMLAAWSILNKVHNKQDKRFSEAVLVVCPNVTIRDRLAELNPKRGEASIYNTRDIVPKSMMSDLSKGRVLTLNWHVFEPRNMQAGNKVVRAGKHILVNEKVFIGAKNTTARGRRYMTEKDLREKQMLGILEILSEEKDDSGELKSAEIRADKFVESDTALLRRVLEKELGTKSNILVFNDEAHHAYRPQMESDDSEQGTLLDDDDMVKEYCNEATVWVKGLDTVQKLRGINFCVDFSATPYFLAKAGANTNRIFPWTVSSFDLQDAIEAGLVKIPQLAVRDPSGDEVPGYFNIWKWILPQLTATERGGKRSDAKPEAILKYAYTPIAMLGSIWQKEFQERKQEGNDPRPPVFIIVCKTKKLADTVYEWLAEDKSPNAHIPSAKLPKLKNTDTEQNTICVHSDMQKNLESGQVKNDEERWMRFTLDTIGKRGWPIDSQGRPQYPDDFEEL